MVSVPDILVFPFSVKDVVKVPSDKVPAVTRTLPATVVAPVPVHVAPSASFNSTLPKASFPPKTVWISAPPLSNNSPAPDSVPLLVTFPFTVMVLPLSANVLFIRIVRFPFIVIGVVSGNVLTDAARAPNDR